MKYLFFIMILRIYDLNPIYKEHFLWCNYNYNEINESIIKYFAWGLGTGVNHGPYRQETKNNTSFGNIMLVQTVENFMGCERT